MDCSKKEDGGVADMANSKSAHCVYNGLVFSSQHLCQVAHNYLEF